MSRTQTIVSYSELETPMPDLTPETLAELRLELDNMRALAFREGVYNGNRAVLDIIARVEPLLNAAEDRDAVTAERDALAAKVERVRALPAKHPAGGWYMISMRDVLAALDGEVLP